MELFEILEARCAEQRRPFRRAPHRASSDAQRAQPAGLLRESLEEAGVGKCGNVGEGFYIGASRKIVAGGQASGQYADSALAEAGSGDMPLRPSHRGRGGCFRSAMRHSKSCSDADSELPVRLIRRRRVGWAAGWRGGRHGRWDDGLEMGGRARVEQGGGMMGGMGGGRGGGNRRGLVAGMGGGRGAEQEADLIGWRTRWRR